MWIKTVLRNGTIADKVSAMSLLITNSAIHNFHALDTLLNITQNRARRESIIVVGEF